MVFGAILLPFVREYDPAPIDLVTNTSANQFAAKIFRPKHVVPTVFSWPYVSEGFPFG